MPSEVWKYPLPAADSFFLPLPLGATCLHFGNQAEAPMLWALVDTAEQTIVKREFRLVGTGQPLAAWVNHRHIGTALFQSGALVFHLFEVVPHHATGGRA